MKKITKKLSHRSSLSLLIIGVFITSIAFLFLSKSLVKHSLPLKEKSTNALMMLIEFERIEGILQWEKELDSRGLTALINVQANILKEYPEVFRRLAGKGYEIAGSYDEKPFWDMPYEEQYNNMKAAKESLEAILKKKVRVFGSRYFAYDENTLKAAQSLGIEYVLGRGTHDIEALIYAPQEYQVKIISISNVDVGEPMGRGSLCDYSLWARGADPTEFGKILAENIAKKPTNMILVSHAYLGGTRLEWWKEYQKALSSTGVTWRGFNDWVKLQPEVVMSNADIPLNKEVKYSTPNPAKPIEDYEMIPGITEEIHRKTPENSISGSACQ